jgi:predicted Rossmann-fold nucleotide-binding protein
MNAIKIVISRDLKTFRHVKKLAKMLHMTRSQFFNQAARRMIELVDNFELFQKINAFYSDDPDDNYRRCKEKTYLYRKAIE